MNLTDKAYQSINADQRAAATVAAMARADNPEVRRLWQTAPRFTGWMADPKFTERMRAFERMALRVALSIEQDAGDSLLWFAMVEHGLNHAEAFTTDALGRMQALGQSARGSAAATWEAFGEVCQRHGIDPDDTLAVFGASLSSQGRDALGDEPTPAILDAMRELLAAIIGEA